MFTNRYRRLVPCSIISCVTLILASCNHPLQVSDLAGTYIVEYSHGREELKLMENGSYTQVYVPNDISKASTVHNSGTWAIQEDNLVLSDPVVIEDQYGDGLSPHYSEKRKGLSLLNIRRDVFGGRISFKVGANSNLSYKRQ